MFLESIELPFQLRLVEEHLNDHMPIVELARNHGIPLAAVRKWIHRFKSDGIEGLKADIAATKARYAKPITKTQLLKIAAKLNDMEHCDDALAEIALRNLTVLAEDVWRIAIVAQKRIPALFTLAALGDVARLDAAERYLGPNYSQWVDGARQKYALPR